MGYVIGFEPVWVAGVPRVTVMVDGILSKADGREGCRAQTALIAVRLGVIQPIVITSKEKCEPT